MQLDEFDRKILAVLASEGRLTTVELAARVGLSPSACTRRIQGLGAAGAVDTVSLNDAGQLHRGGF